MSSQELTFRGGARTLLGFLVAFVLFSLVMMPVKEAAADSSVVFQLAYNLGKFGLLAGIGLVALRQDGVRVANLGLSPRHVAPAIVAFGGVWAALNAFGVGLATVIGNPWGLNVLRETTPIFFGDVPMPRLVTLLYFFLVVGVVEEFVFRGYLQTKVITMVGDDTRPRIALGVLAASLVFGLAHVPGALVAGASVKGVLSLVAITAASGIVFGTFYEATQNLYFVAFLHGFGDTWPLVADAWSWSRTAVGAFLLAIVFVYGGVTMAYRYWALGTELTPDVRRRNLGQSASASGSAAPSETTESQSE